MLSNSFSIIKYTKSLPAPEAKAFGDDIQESYLYKEAKLCVKVNPDSSMP